MIACPQCGLDTVVAETRSIGAHNRRRRECVNRHRVTTIEMIVASGRGLALEDMTLIRRSLLVDLKQIVNDIDGGAP